MTPEPNKHRRVRECLGEWRKRCILHSIFGGNTRAVARMVMDPRRTRGTAVPVGVDVVKVGQPSTDASADPTTDGSEVRSA